MEQTIQEMIGTIFEAVPKGADAKGHFVAEVTSFDEKIAQPQIHRIRVFGPKDKTQDEWFFGLPHSPCLPIKFKIYGKGMFDCQFAASALPLKDQTPAIKAFVKSTTNSHEPVSILSEVREQVSVVKSSDIDPVGHWIDNNPEIVLSKSQQRVRGKTDKELMTIVNIFAKRKGVKPCDVINAVMWESVHNGSIWKTQIEESNAES
jgi:hypothetical protein